jgi:hypothetical protein
MGKFFSRRYAVEWLLIGGLFWLTSDQFILGKYSWLRMLDSGNIAIPGLLANATRGFEWPLWHSFSTAGTDRLSLGYMGALDTFLFQLLPGWLALQIRAVSQCVISALATYALCRRSLDLDRLASAFAALTMGFHSAAGFLVLSVDDYLPASVLALALVLERRSDWKRWLFLIAVGGLISLTAYMSRLVPFVFLIHLLWFAVVDRKRNAGDWLIIIGFSVFATLLRGQDVVALMAHGLLTDRHATFVADVFSLSALADHVLSFFYGSWVRLLMTGMMVFALIVSRRRHPALWRVAAALAIGLAMVVAVPLVKPLLADVLPILSSFKLIRFNKFFVLFLAVGAAYAIVALRETAPSTARRWMIWRRPASAAALAFVALFLSTLPIKYAHVREWISQGGYVLNFESPVLAELGSSIRRRGEIGRAVSFQIYANIANAYGIETADGYQALQIKRYRQFWDRTTAASRRNAPPADLGDRMYLMVNPADHQPEWRLADLYDADLLALANVRYVLSRDRLVDSALVPLHQPATPWSALTRDQKIDSNLRANFTGRTLLFVYRLEGTLPRYFLVSGVRPFDSEAELLDAIGDAPRDELARVMFVDRALVPDGLDTGKRFAAGRIQVIANDGDEIHLTVDLEGDGVLFAGNAYSPYWKAYVDGVETAIFPADHAFWGVALPATARQVVFRYEPPHRLF